MDFGPTVFFAFIAAIIIVPQVLRHLERGRLHDTMRLAFERGQPVPPELFAALQSRRRYYAPSYDPGMVGATAGWQRSGVYPQPGTTSAPPPAPEATIDPVAPAGMAQPAAPQPVPVVYVSQRRADMRRGFVWLAVGLGLFGAGAAFYAGLYDVGGAPETFATFAAFGAIPFFIGLTYLALARYGQEKAGT